jgi:hypothetical protein
MFDMRQTKAEIAEGGMKLHAELVDALKANEILHRLLSNRDAEITQLRATLYEVTTNGRWTEGEQCGEWAISKEVYETARDAQFPANDETAGAK